METSHNVFKAISQVSDALRKQGISKDKRCNGGGNFAYRGIDDVYAALSPALIDAHLIIAPTTIVKESDAVIAGKSNMRLVRIAINYTVTCTDDASAITVMSLGEGCDTTDKAVGKAMSYAYKNLMFQLFCIPVRGQDDPDSVALEPQGTFIDEKLLSGAKEAAMGGLKNYSEFWAKLTPEQRKSIGKERHEEFKKMAGEFE